MEELKATHDILTMWVLFISLHTSISSGTLANGPLDLQEILRHSFTQNAPGLKAYLVHREEKALLAWAIQLSFTASYFPMRLTND